MTTLTKPVRRNTGIPLDGSFCKDRGRNIVITLNPNGTIELRPLGTRRAESVAVVDVYRFALRCRTCRDLLEKARAQKAKIAQRLADRRQAAAERRLIA